jgi:GntR family transcriptional regulator
MSCTLVPGALRIYPWLAGSDRSATGRTGLVEIDYGSPVSPHRQIADWIRGMIERGDIPPDRPVPSEESIRQETGAARTTARRAIRLLREEGWVYTVPGRGSYAKHPPESA